MGMQGSTVNVVPITLALLYCILHDVHLPFETIVLDVCVNTDTLLTL